MASYLLGSEMQILRGDEVLTVYLLFFGHIYSIDTMTSSYCNSLDMKDPEM